MTTRMMILGGALILAIAIGCSKKNKSSETGSTRTSQDSTTTQTVQAYRAFGNEPFWSVTIDATGLRFTSPEDSSGISFPPVEPIAAGDTLRWASKSDRGGIIVRIWSGPCSDGMSDRTWSHASAVNLNETTYLGCAETSTQPVR